MENNLDEFTKRRLEKQNPKLELGHFSDLAESIFNLVKTIPGKTRGSNIYLEYQKDLSQKNDARLIEIANRADKNSITRHPFYYLAIVDEILKRKIIEKYE